jgi:hypothetical protein
MPVVHHRDARSAFPFSPAVAHASGMTLVELFPDWLVEVAYEVVARGSHVAPPAFTALVLATALAMAGSLVRTITHSAVK